MIIHVVFAQRTCRYPGQYAPEALDVADENTMEDNPGYLIGRKEKYENEKEFDSVVIIPIRVDAEEVYKRLLPNVSPINGEIK